MKRIVFCHFGFDFLVIKKSKVPYFPDNVHVIVIVFCISPFVSGFTV